MEADSTGWRGYWIIGFGFIIREGFCVEGVGMGIEESEGERGCCYEDAGGDSSRESWRSLGWRVCALDGIGILTIFYSCREGRYQRFC